MYLSTNIRHFLQAAKPKLWNSFTNCLYKWRYANYIYTLPLIGLAPQGTQYRWINKTAAIYPNPKFYVNEHEFQCGDMNRFNRIESTNSINLIETNRVSN